MARKKEVNPEASAAAAALGRLGGPARARVLSAKRRREIAGMGGRAAAANAARKKK